MSTAARTGSAQPERAVPTFGETIDPSRLGAVIRLTAPEAYGNAGPDVRSAAARKARLAEKKAERLASHPCRSPRRLPRSLPLGDLGK